MMIRRNLLASTCVKPPIEPEHVIPIHDMIPGCTYTAVIDSCGVITEIRGPRRADGNA